MPLQAFHRRTCHCITRIRAIPRRRLYSSKDGAIDFRSDTVTMPSIEMLETPLTQTARFGDDVMAEDIATLELEDFVANLTGKEKALFVPTCTMANIAAILSHCHTRASEILVGASSHISLWEGGGAANIGGVHTRQIKENEDAKMDTDQIRDNVFPDTDDHCAKTNLLCLENTHNMLGGVALPPSYVQEMASLAQELNLKTHMDGARIFNAAAAQNLSVKELCTGIDSVSICFSKGLGAPAGSILAGDCEFIRLAKRARKRLGGGMRQVGVLASMCHFAVKNNVERLHEDHVRAKTIATELKAAGFYIPREGVVDTNIVYFGLPKDLDIETKDFSVLLDREYGVKLTGGYSQGGKLFRLVTHMGVDDEQTNRAIDAMVKIRKQYKK